MVVFQDISGTSDRVQKICDSFMGQRFDIPELGRVPSVVENTEKEVTKSRQLLNTSVYQLKQYLYDINNNRDEQGNERASTLEIFAWFVAKEKAIYTALNMMKSRSSTYIGFLWAPIEKEHVIQETISFFGSTDFKQIKRGAGNNHIIVPPTYFKVNDVTFVYQEITNTYGVPAYHEANPAVFAMVTFPFLFAVMFGDYGHGSLILLVGTFLVLFAEKLKGTPAEPILQLRYLFFLMGCFSCYTGLLYNEWFAISADWFGSCFDTSTVCLDTDLNCNPSFLPVGCTNYPAESCNMDCVYPFGVDPAWSLSPQLLTYTNNIKMKLSVIIGVIHMSIGICVKGSNSIYFGRMLDLIFEVFTGLIILLGLFGWMDLLIFSKWTYGMNPYSIDPLMI